LLEESSHNLKSNNDFNTSLDEETFANPACPGEVKLIAQSGHSHEIVNVANGQVVRVTDQLLSNVAISPLSSSLCRWKMR